MSLETWKKEFFPKPANAKMTKKQAVVHSLRKWRGLREENLRFHNVQCNGGFLEDGKEDFKATSGAECALCNLYVIPYKDCSDCPLNISEGRSCFSVSSSYQIYYGTGDPEPMIAALEKTLEACRETFPLQYQERHK